MALHYWIQLLVAISLMTSGADRRDGFDDQTDVDSESGPPRPATEAFPETNHRYDTTPAAVDLHKPPADE